MDPAPSSPAPVPAAPPPAQPSLLAAWPHPAQLAAVALLVLATVLLTFHAFGSWRGGARPTEVQSVPVPVYHSMEATEAPTRVSRPAETHPKASAPAPSSRSTKAAKLTGTINLNRASAEELQQLPCIGPKMAQRIIDERRTEPFRSVDDLRRVPGIGPKTLERLRPHVTLNAGPARMVSAAHGEGAN